MGTRTVKAPKKPKPGTEWPVPSRIIVPILNQKIKDTGRNTNSFMDEEWEEVQRDCGPEYAGHLRGHIRIQGERLRQRAKLLHANGHAPAKRRPEKKKMDEYCLTPHWLKFAREVREYWGYCCAICNHSKPLGEKPQLDVHHRTYSRVGHELPTDCIALCRKCHDLFHKRHDWENSGGEVAVIPLEIEPQLSFLSVE